MKTAQAKHLAVAQLRRDGGVNVSIAGKIVATRPNNRSPWRGVGGPQDGVSLGRASLKRFLAAATRMANEAGMPAGWSK
jgi:hypothetical protein